MYVFFFQVLLSKFYSSVSWLFNNELTFIFAIFYITACSGKSSTSPSSQPPGAGSLPPPHIDDSTMPYTGGSQVGSAMAAPRRIVLIVAVLGAVTAALGVLAKFLGLFKHCCNQAAAAGVDG